MLRIVDSSSDWENVLQRVQEASVVSRAAYLEAGSLLEQDGRSELAVWEDGGELLVHPYVRREIPDEPSLDDITSVFEFGGFWFSTTAVDVRRRLMRGFAEPFAEYCRASKIVSEFIRVHPFSDIFVLADGGYEVNTIAQHTVVPLDRPYEEIRAGFRHSLRKAVAKADRAGLRIESSDDFEPFVRIYHDNLDRLRAREYYYFPLEFFERARSMFQLYYAFDRRGDLCAGHVYLHDGDHVFAFLCHGVADKLELRPNDSVYDYVICRLAQSGRRYLHLGGGHPSLVRYKQRFSSELLPVCVAKRIFDADRYASLVAGREAHLGVPLGDASYFPRYRASPPRPEEQPTLARMNAPTLDDKLQS